MFKNWIIPLAGILMLANSPTSVAGGGVVKPLLECSNSPNCVSTEAKPEDSKHYMPPLPYSGTSIEAIEKIENIIKSMARVEIVEKSDYSLHAVFKTKILRFKDDVEFVVDEKDKVIRFRSASRTGYSDFGVNRKRMEKICSKFAQE